MVVMVRGHGRETSSGLRAFYKEISCRIGGKKISGYQGVQSFSDFSVICHDRNAWPKT